MSAPSDSQDDDEPGTVYIAFNGQITRDTVNVLQNTMANLHAQDEHKRFYFLFSSPGGSVRAGIHLYRVLSALPETITMHNTSSIDSIATVIFLAGDDRYAAPGTSFLFHGVTANFPGGPMSYSQLKEHMSSIEQDEQKIIELVSRNSSLTEDELENLHRQGQAKGTDFAVDKDLVSKVMACSVPSDADFVSVG